MKVVLGLTLAVAALSAAVPATARGQAATVQAYDFGFRDAATGSATVTVAPGAEVAFAYPDGGSAHNVIFDAVAPTSCTQTAGANSGAVPPLPAIPTAEGWTGTCRFDTPGTYDFHCGLHDFMTGRVQAGGPPPPVPAAPGAPSGVAATAGDGRATVAFAAPADNGAAITRYTVTASPGGRQATGSASPITVTGLANGTSYTFTVTATNAAGTGPPSPPSAAVTPHGAGTPDPSGTSPTGSGSFAIVRVRARASGVVRLSLALPAAGRLAVRARFAGTTRAYARRAVDVRTAGALRLRLRPGARVRRALRRMDRAPAVDLRVRFTPTGGQTRTVSRRGVRIPRRGTG